MGIQVRQLERLAKKHKIEVRRGAPWACAVGVMKAAMSARTWESHETVAHHFGLSLDNLQNLECGFESWYSHDLTNGKPADQNNIYFKVGQRFAKRIGLPEKPISNYNS